MAQLPDPAAAAAWEALDVDDSDIRLGPPSTAPLPRPCSSTLSAQDKPAHPSHHHRIPEPAAAAQDTTRLHPAAGSPPAALGCGDARAPDADFLLPPWLCALQFLGRSRAWEQPGIKAIKEDEALYRAPLVAGVVTSCKPNGLGDLLVTLKDPSDTIAAAVHKKVLLESNNDQDISAGCVILLSKVAIFRPTRKACYLNVTRVFKVFRKNCDAPSKQVISSITSERSEGSTNNIMMRLLGHERMMPSSNEMTCSQPSLCGSRVMIGDRNSTQASANENFRRPPDDEKCNHSRKKLKSDATLHDGYGDTANSRIDAENNLVLERNMNTELYGMPEQFNGEHASVREPMEHQQRNFTSVNAGNVQPTKESATATSGSLINPKKTLPVASLGGWTDDQISELFSDL